MLFRGNGSLDILGNFLTNHKYRVFDKIINRIDYIIGEHKLLKNYDKLLYDQMPYRDYPPRSV